MLDPISIIGWRRGFIKYVFDKTNWSWNIFEIIKLDAYFKFSVNWIDVCDEDVWKIDNNIFWIWGQIFS